MNDFFRERNDQEKNLKDSGFKDIRKWRNTDVKQKMLKSLNEVSHRTVHKDRKPYCRRCGVKKIESEILKIDEKIKNAINSGNKNPKLEIDIDYEEFSDAKNFKLVDTEDVEGPEYKGSNKIIKKGERKNFECKKCGALFSVEYTLEEIENEKNQSKSNSSSGSNNNNPNK